MSIMEDALNAILCKTTSFIFVKDLQGKYVAASDSYAALFGFQSGVALVGKTDYDFVKDRKNAEHYTEIDTLVMKNGIVLYDLVEPNFTDAADVKWTSTSKYPICDGNGNITGLVAEGYVINSRYERHTAYEYDLRSVVELSSDTCGALVCDVTDGKVIEFHSHGEWKPQIGAGMSWDDLMAMAKRHILIKNEDGTKIFAAAKYQNIVSMYRSGRKVYSIEYFWDEGKNSRWVRMEAHIFSNPDTGHLLVALIFHDIGAEHAARDALVERTHHDSLTGLLNHEGTIKQIQAALLQGRKGCLFMLDVDDFKKINDTCGHPVGDEALIAIGKIMLNSFRSGDIVGRVGGDEFMVYTNAPGSLSTARKRGIEILERIRALHLSDSRCRMTVSIGIAKFKGHESFERLYSRADAMLYVSKKLGKHQVVAEGDQSAYGTSFN